MAEIKYRSFTRKELADGKFTTKGDLAREMGLNRRDVEYDKALPQGWLDEFVERTGLAYWLVTSTTFFVYDMGSPAFGRPVSGCKEVQEEIEKWK